VGGLRGRRRCILFGCFPRGIRGFSCTARQDTFPLEERMGDEERAEGVFRDWGSIPIPACAGEFRGMNF